MDLIRKEHKNGLVTYQSPLLNNAGAKHGFSTRLGGTSKKEYASLNLDLRNKSADKDFNLAISENFRRLRAALDIQRIARVELKQVHADNVFHVSGKPTTPANAPCADSAIYDKPDRLLAVRIADCVPILLSSKNGAVVGAVHAGWRGIIAGVIPKTIQKLNKVFSLVPDNIICAIGPSISGDYFEVGDEVVDKFKTAKLENSIIDNPKMNSAITKAHIDLKKAALKQLINSQIKENNIDCTSLCTYSNEKEFFSYRRDKGKTGRMAAVIVARQNG